MPSYSLLISLLGQIYVTQDARSFGFGELLFACALKAGLDHGAKKFHLMCCSKNGAYPYVMIHILSMKTYKFDMAEPARRLYAKYGFKVRLSLLLSPSHDHLIC